MRGELFLGQRTLVVAIERQHIGILEGHNLRWQRTLNILVLVFPIHAATGTTKALYTEYDQSYCLPRQESMQVSNDTMKIDASLLLAELVASQ